MTWFPGHGKRISIQNNYPALNIYSRPLNQRGERVPVYALERHKASHDFNYPSCLCADDGRDTLTESAIFRVQSGPYDNYWAAACAEDACGYFGKPFNIY